MGRGVNAYHWRIKLIRNRQLTSCDITCDRVACEITCDRVACDITCDRVACGSGFVLLPRLFCTAGPEHSHADWQTK